MDKRYIESRLPCPIRLGPMDYTPGERLDLYVELADELLNTRAVQDHAFNIELTIKGGINQPFMTKSREPTEEVLKAFLLTFRHFMMYKEPVSVNGVANIVWQNLRSDQLKGMLEETRKQWRQECRQGPLQLIINQDRLTPEQAMDLWINGKYFHSDKRKRERLESLDPLGRLFTRHVFLNHIISATNYVVFLAQVIVVGRRQGLLSP